jgi:hypothetical protein
MLYCKFAFYEVLYINFISNSYTQRVFSVSNTTITLNGKHFVWDGSRWYGARDYLEPPASVICKLNALMEDQFAAEDEAVTEPQELLSMSKRIQEAGQLGRALRFARRSFQARPDDAGTAAVLSSILRKAQRPEEALDVGDRFRASSYRPILTSRAAALCDLERWDEALRQIRQVFAIGEGKGSEEALLVWNRIAAAAPELLDK